MAKSIKSYQPLQFLGINSQEDLPANRFIGFDGFLCKNGAKSFGVTEVGWLNGELISVVSLGTAIVESAEALSVGQDVTSNDDGKAILAGPGAIVNGRIIEGCNSAGFIKILIVP